MQDGRRKDVGLGLSAFPRLHRRIWPIVISIVYVILGMAYEFRWGPIVRHVPSSWIGPGDLLSDYGTAIQFATGHFSAVYQPGRGFLSYPGLLLALAPLAAINNVFHGSWINIKVQGHLVAHPQVFLAPHLPSPFWYQGNLGPNTTHGIEQVIQPSAYPSLILLALVYSCLALFACDALAERLQVPRSRRAVLAAAEAAVLWNVTIIFGHPEDTVAVAFAIYALIFAVDGRFVGAGWLFGIALAFQPLALMVLPLLLFIGGKERALGLVARGVIPAAVLTAPPLIANVHGTFHQLVAQPTFPKVSTGHATPWTFLAPKLGGKGKGEMVGGGPPRIAVVVIATAFGAWARRWRDRPEMLAWAVAVALSIRVFLETVMYSYYIWPALAVAMVVAARGSNRRFGIAVVLAIVLTVVTQWHMSWVLWWFIVVVGMTGVLVTASRPQALVALPRGQGRSAARPRAAAMAGGRSGTTKAAKNRSGPAPAQRHGAARDRAGAAKASGSTPARAKGNKKSAAARTGTKKSPRR
jgi:hypothetical protein